MSAVKLRELEDPDVGDRPFLPLPPAWSVGPRHRHSGTGWGRGKEPTDRRRNGTLEMTSFTLNPVLVLGRVGGKGRKGGHLFEPTSADNTSGGVQGQLGDLAKETLFSEKVAKDQPADSRPHHT